MYVQIDKQSSISNRFLDGSITISSNSEFKKMLQIFPKSPSFHRAYADFLVRKKSFYAAADEYKKAVSFYLESGRILQAITAKILEWTVNDSFDGDGSNFHKEIHEASHPNIPLYHFLIKMSENELLAFMERLVTKQCPSGKFIKRVNDEENELIFIVSGAVNEIKYIHINEETNVKKNIKKELKENDFFGDVYPFEENKTSQSDIESITPVELVKISKESIIELFEEYPETEGLIKDLYKINSESGDERSSYIVRKSQRYQVPIKVTIKSLRDKRGKKSPLFVEGFTKDISLGGACVMLGAKYLTGSSYEMIGRNINIGLGLSKSNEALNILGTVVWSKEISAEGKTFLEVGIEFNEITASGSELLKKYCYETDGAQNMICSLWESLLKQ